MRFKAQPHRLILYSLEHDDDQLRLVAIIGRRRLSMPITDTAAGVLADQIRLVLQKRKDAA